MGYSYWLILYQKGKHCIEISVSGDWLVEMHWLFQK